MSVALHIIFKLLKYKKDKPQKKIVKEARGGEKKNNKYSTSRETRLRITMAFLSEALRKKRMEWNI